MIVFIKIINYILQEKLDKSLTQYTNLKTCSLPSHVEHAHHADQQVINILIDADYHTNIHHADQCFFTSGNMAFKSDQCTLMEVVAMFKSNQCR